MTTSFGSTVTAPFAGLARISMTTGIELHWLSARMCVVICDFVPDVTVADSAHADAGATSAASARPTSKQVFMTEPSNWACHFYLIFYHASAVPS
jgi:hypothetical protein